MRRRRGPAHPQSLEQGLIAEASLEAASRVLDQAVEDDEGTQLAVDVAVLELLADGARSLGGARGLDGDDLDELGDAAEVIFLVGLGGEGLDRDGYGREGFLEGKGMLAVAEVGGLAHRGASADAPASLVIARPADRSSGVVALRQLTLSVSSERTGSRGRQGASTRQVLFPSHVAPLTIRRVLNPRRRVRHRKGGVDPNDQVHGEGQRPKA